MLECAAYSMSNHGICQMHLPCPAGLKIIVVNASIMSVSVQPTVARQQCETLTSIIDQNIDAAIFRNCFLCKFGWKVIRSHISRN